MNQECCGKCYPGCCIYSDEEFLMEADVYYRSGTEKIKIVDLENTLMSADFENNMMIEFQVSYKESPRVFYTYEMTKSEFLNTFMPKNKDRIDYIKCQKINS